MAYTQEQQEIIDSSAQNIVGKAFAGTGKTATAIGYMKARPKASFLYLAFNKSAADAMNAKLAAKHILNARAMTLHGFSLSVLEMMSPGWFRSRITNKLEPSVFESAFPSGLTEGGKLYASRAAGFAVTLYEGFLKSTFQAPSHFLKTNLSPEFESRLIMLKMNKNKLAAAFDQFWVNSVEPDSSLPITHDTYFHMAYNVSVYLHQQSGGKKSFFSDRGYTHLIIDEAQDLFPPALEMARQSEDMHRLFLGDPYQQIYGWNLSVNVLNELAARPDFEVKELTQSFRCSEHVAHEVAPYLAISGATSTFHGISEDCFQKSEKPQTARLYRSNAVLLQSLNDFMEQGNDPSSIYVFGGKQSFNFTYLIDICNLEDRCLHRVQTPLLKKFVSLQEYAAYTADCNDIPAQSAIRLIRKIGTMSMRQIIEKVTKAEFAKNPEFAQHIFSTAHKAKGAEFDIVILGEDFISLHNELIEASSISSENHAAKRMITINLEEFRLLYVAMTRAKENLEYDYETYKLDEFVLKQLARAVETEEVAIVDTNASGEDIDISQRCIENFASFLKMSPEDYMPKAHEDINGNEDESDDGAALRYEIENSRIRNFLLDIIREAMETQNAKEKDEFYEQESEVSSPCPIIFKKVFPRL